MRFTRFMNYYGSKKGSAHKYPAPVHETIIEPFAGGAGYSCLHYEKKVILYEKNKIVSDTWKYLIESGYDDIVNLPIEFDDLRNVNIEKRAKYLIGFKINSTCTYPNNTRSKWAIEKKDYFWSEKIREKIAVQSTMIKHWEAHHVDDYSHIKIPEYNCTWFIDPPYQKQGVFYKHSDIDYDHLRDWVFGLPGQKIICGNKDDDWMEFDNGHFIVNNKHEKKKELFIEIN